MRSQGKKVVMQRAGERSRREKGSANLHSSLKKVDRERHTERFC